METKFIPYEQRGKLKLLLERVEGRPINEVIPGYNPNYAWWARVKALESLASKGSSDRQVYNALLKIAKYDNCCFVVEATALPIWNYRHNGNARTINWWEPVDKLEALCEKGDAPQKVVEQLRNGLEEGGLYQQWHYTGSSVKGNVHAQRLLRDMIESYDKRGDFRDTQHYKAECAHEFFIF